MAPFRMIYPFWATFTGRSPTGRRCDFPCLLCTAQQLTIFQLTQSVARSRCDSRASCLMVITPRQTGPRTIRRSADWLVRRLVALLDHPVCTNMIHSWKLECCHKSSAASSHDVGTAWQVADVAEISEALPRWRNKSLVAIPTAAVKAQFVLRANNNVIAIRNYTKHYLEQCAAPFDVSKLVSS